MEYRSLGRTQIRVSVLCLGTMTYGEQNTVRDAHAQLDYAVDQGVNFIDTAELYAIPPKPETQGATERILGRWLALRRCREQLIIASKATGPGSWVNYIRGGPRLDRSHIFAAIDQTLKRLQTDYVDLYQVHWPERRSNFFGHLGYPWPDDSATDTANSPGVPIEETLRALAGLVEAGKARAVGVSNESPWGVMRYLQAAETLDLPRIACIQNPYSLINRTFEIGLAEFSHREDVGLLAYSPLGMGVLSGKYLGGARPAGARLTLFERFGRYTGPQAAAATAEYVKLAREHGLDPAQMALAYVRSRPFLTSAIIGATNMEQLERNLGSLDVHLDESVFAGIEAVHTRYPNPAP